MASSQGDTVVSCEALKKAPTLKSSEPQHGTEEHTQFPFPAPYTQPTSKGLEILGEGQWIDPAPPESSHYYINNMKNNKLINSIILHYLINKCLSLYLKFANITPLPPSSAEISQF